MVLVKCNRNEPIPFNTFIADELLCEMELDQYTNN